MAYDDSWDRPHVASRDDQWQESDCYWFFDRAKGVGGFHRIGFYPNRAQGKSMLFVWAGDRRYYAKDWGNLRLIALDGGIECRDGCTQYAYAEKALAEAEKLGQLTVMFLHFPPYSSGKHGSHKGVQTAITELAKRHGVELVIAGHDHNYERTKVLDGTTYVVSGSAGAPTPSANITPVRNWASASPCAAAFSIQDRASTSSRATPWPITRQCARLNCASARPVSAARRYQNTARAGSRGKPARP